MSIKVKKIIAVVLAISSLLALCSCSAGREKIDLEDYITIEFSKYNGYGTVSIDVDEEGIENLIDYEKKEEFYADLTEDNREASLALAFLDEGTDMFSVELAEEYENLSNGDKVKVVVKSELEQFGCDINDIEKGLGIKFKDTEVTYKVEGLVDAKTLDVFEGIEECIKFVNPVDEEKTAISGSAKAEIVIPNDFERVVDGMYLVRGDYRNTLKVVYNNQRLAEITFSIESSQTYFSSGEKFTVVASGGSSLEEYDYLLAEYTKEYTVPKLAERVTSKSQLSADKISKIKSDTLQYVKDELSATTVYDFYCYEIKPSSDANIKCYIVATTDYKGWFDTHATVAIYPIILPDGTWEYEIERTGRYDSLEEATEYITSNNDYTYEKI